MQFVEFEREYSRKQVLSIFSHYKEVNNELMLEKAVVTENKNELEDLNLYANGNIRLKDATFKINISLFNALEELVVEGCVARDKGIQKLTDKGQRLILKYTGDSDFTALLSIADKSFVISNKIDWQKFSKDLIEILNLNERQYAAK